MKKVTLDTGKIESHYLDGNDEVTEVILTDRVKSIGSFAFYRCRNLQTIRLSDSVVDYYDGAIRDLTSLRVIEVDIRNGNYSVVRDMLADVDTEIVFHLTIESESVPDGGQFREKQRPRSKEALLVFPSYVSIAEENTWARQINVAIQGSGMGYREAVMRKQIKYREYDSQFEKAAIDNTVTAAKVALGRLMFPLDLQQAGKNRYENYLRAHTRDVLLWLAGGRVLTRTEDKAMDLSAAAVAAEVDSEAAKQGLPVFAEFTAVDLVRFLAEQQLIDQNEIDPALKIAAERKDAELSAALMEAGRTGTERPDTGDGKTPAAEESFEEFVL